MKTLLVRALLLAALCGLSMPVRGALYTVGSVVENFSLVDRATGKPVQLTDFAGKIIVLDWFAWWCPFCQAAAPQLLSGIDEWYAARAGNPAGIPVVHVGVNLQPGQEAQTQNFVTRAKLDLVLQDFDRALANRVATDGQPIFAIINGVTNSPSHKPWQLLYSRRGYGQTTFPVADFRGAIDAVKAPVVVPLTAPAITTPPTAQTVDTGQAVQFSVTASGSPALAYQWRKDGTALAGQTSSTLTLAAVTAGDDGSYDVVVTNPAGSAVSAIAVLTVRTAPGITKQPAGLVLDPGQAARFSVTASGSPALVYQWRKDGAALAGQTSSTLTLAAVMAGDDGAYDVLVTNPAGSAASAAAVLVVRVPPALGVPALRADGALVFTVRGKAGLVYRTESSADLKDWTVEAEHVSAGPEETVTVPADGRSSGRFFRIVVR